MCEHVTPEPRLLGINHSAACHVATADANTPKVTPGVTVGATEQDGHV
jgi:hypothetical protein